MTALEKTARGLRNFASDIAQGFCSRCLQCFVRFAQGEYQGSYGAAVFDLSEPARGGNPYGGGGFRREIFDQLRNTTVLRPIAWGGRTRAEQRRQDRHSCDSRLLTLPLEANVPAMRLRQLVRAERMPHKGSRC